MLELKTITEIIRDSLVELNSILDTADKMTNDCEDRLLEIMQTEGQKGKIKKHE